MLECTERDTRCRARVEKGAVSRQKPRIVDPAVRADDTDRDMGVNSVVPWRGGLASERRTLGSMGGACRHIAALAAHQRGHRGLREVLLGVPHRPLVFAGRTRFPNCGSRLLPPARVPTRLRSGEAGARGWPPSAAPQANDIAAKKTRGGAVSHVDNPERRRVASDLPWGLAGEMGAPTP